MVRHNDAIAIVFIALVGLLGFVWISRAPGDLQRRERAADVAARQVDVVRDIALLGPHAREPSVRVALRDYAGVMEATAQEQGTRSPAIRRFAFAARYGDRAEIAALAPVVGDLERFARDSYRQDWRARKHLIVVEKFADFALVLFAVLLYVRLIYRPMQREIDAQHAAMVAQIDALERSEARLARAQRTARAGVWEVELRTGSVSCTDQVYDLVGSGERFVPDVPRLMAFVHPDDRGRVVSAVRRARRQRTSFALDIRLVRGDGSICWVQQHGEFTFDRTSDRAVSFFGTALDVTARKVAEERLAYRALHDSLTELPNRLLLLDRLEGAVERARRSRNEGAVVFVDLDSFKEVNDTYGHLVGDLYLKEAARRLRAIVRETDTVARNGGDEFVLLLENVGTRDAFDRLLVEIVATLKYPYELGVMTLSGSASVGVSFFCGEEESPDDLIRSADAAMYYAKQAGGGDARTYDSELRDETEARLALEKDVRGAGERSEFDLAFQPIVDVASGGRITAFEALIRWHHPTLGTIEPVRFIESIEANGLIVIVGEWVLRTACASARRWHEAGYRQLAIAVNVSARQLQSEGFVAMVARTLAETGYPPRLLELELTESAIMNDIDAAIDAVRTLRDLGVRIAIDDFGTGYSTIAYLKHFDADTVKIDRMFVRDLIDGRRDCDIVRSITALAHNLGCRVVAEGVETAEQVALLCELECDALQGYYYGRPIPAAELDAAHLDELMLAPRYLPATLTGLKAM